VENPTIVVRAVLCCHSLTATKAKGQVLKRTRWMPNPGNRDPLEKKLRMSA